MGKATTPSVIPARMLNEYAYCPRLAYLEWVQGEWADSADTLEGKHAHRRVEKGESSRPRIHNRSVQLTSHKLGVTAVVDIIEIDGSRARPVDYKKGKKPGVSEGAYEPERVQLCVQGLLLREQGFRCNEGVIYYANSKQRIRIRFTSALVARTLGLLAELRREFDAGRIPPPLEDSPKCPRCSLVKICMPEETRFLASGGRVRPLAVEDPQTFPLVVQQPGSSVRLDGEQLVVHCNGERVAAARLGETSQVVLMSGSSCSAAVINECCLRGIPVTHMSGTGWFYGITMGMIHKNVQIREEQFAAARDPERCLPVARSLVRSKIHNSRVHLRRNGNAPEAALEEMAGFASDAAAARTDETLLGIEGSAARVYFSHLSTMLKRPKQLPEFQFENRNKRPPTDPINALLSFVYTLLVKDWTVCLYSIGLDPMMGLYHKPRYGKPALALDLMEPFRPVIADSVVVGVLNNGEIAGDDFIEQMGSVLLKPAARKRLIGAYERRLAQEIVHPVFGYACTYRRIFEIQARLLGRYLLSEIPDFPRFEVR